LSRNPEKQRSLAVQEQLQELSRRQSDLASDLEQLETANDPNEREKLLQQVKDHNQEITTMESRIAELEDTKRRLEDQLAQLVETLAQNQTDKNAKFEELLKRDAEMQEFLKHYEQQYPAYVNEKQQRQHEIEGLLDRLRDFDRQMEQRQLDPAGHIKKSMYDLSQIESQLFSRNVPMETIVTEHEKYQRELHQLKQLGEQTQKERDGLEAKLKQLQELSVRVTNIEQTKKTALNQKEELHQKKTTLNQLRTGVRGRIQEMELEHKKLKKHLDENDTYVQLNALEQRIKFLESSNGSVRDQMAAKKQEMDTQPLVNRLRQLADEYHHALQKSLMAVSVRGV
jgi:intraflagellar transport protein 74